MAAWDCWWPPFSGSLPSGSMKASPQGERIQVGSSSGALSTATNVHGVFSSSTTSTM